MVSFAELTEAVKNESFSDGRISTIETLAPTLPFFGSPAEIKELLEAFSFSDEKIKAIDALVSKYDNFTAQDLSAMLQALSFSDDRKKALKKVIPKIWMRMDLNTVLNELTFSDEKDLCRKLWAQYQTPTAAPVVSGGADFDVVAANSMASMQDPSFSVSTNVGQVDMTIPNMQVDMSVPGMQVDMNMGPGMAVSGSMTVTESTTVNGVTTTTTIGTPDASMQVGGTVGMNVGGSMGMNVGGPGMGASVSVGMPAVSVTVPGVTATIGAPMPMMVQQPVIFHVKRLGGFMGPKWQERMMRVSYGPNAELERMFKHMGKDVVKAKVKYSDIRAVYRTVAPFESFRHPYTLCIEFHSNRLDFLSFSDSNDRESFITNLVAAAPHVKLEADHNAIVSMGKWAWMKRSFSSPYENVDFVGDEE